MKISKLLTICSFVISAFLFTGCPYDNENPLSEASGKFPPYLLGIWEQADNTGVKVDVKAGDNGTAKIVKTTINEGSDPTIENFSIHVTEIEGVTFLNVKELSDFGNTFYFYKVTKESDNKIVLSAVTSNIREKFESSDVMKKFFATNMKNSYFFDITDETYYKIK